MSNNTFFPEYTFLVVVVVVVVRQQFAIRTETVLQNKGVILTFMHCNLVIYFVVVVE